MGDESLSLEHLTEKLLPNTRLANPPYHSTFSNLTATISSLQLHPTLEATLHILNSDLPSAHFLVRRMQAPPAVEGMLLHGILHRAEGDFDNARAWISDVKDVCDGFQPKNRDEGKRLDDDVVEKTKGGKGVKGTLVEFVYDDEDPMEVIDAVEAFRGTKIGSRTDGEEAQIEFRGRRELERVLQWCRNKFGDGRWADARDAWVKNSEEISKISGDMVSGARGHRQF